eukprot:gnl/MRDRNA2_/MRDRNA2_88344_c0_seq1.p1 gnl/MRDRNA2_/MRDRNA2_88344_c0~~gnl/MRDRNA2_/MRDRNA2_88344_c0_seq1.p1  ORF type:complete len:361 (-),score=40.04 gnl/MRDRNA2_/MRDRNA2_88344_c0_seq1:294-1376(-)
MMKGLKGRQSQESQGSVKPSKGARVASMFINFVNPKLSFFSRPLLLAVLIGGGTIVLLVNVFSIMMLNATTTMEKEIAADPAPFVFRNQAASNANFCLAGVLKEGREYCIPDPIFFTLAHLETLPPEMKASYYANPEPLEWCETLDDYGRMPTANEKWAFGKDVCESKGPFSEVPSDYCRPCPGDGAVLHWYMYKTVHPSAGATLGSALGYATYIEVALTVVIVSLCVSCRCVKNQRPDFGLLAVSMDEMSSNKGEIENFRKRIEDLEARLQAAEANGEAAKSASLRVAGSDNGAPVQMPQIPMQAAQVQMQPAQVPMQPAQIPMYAQQMPPTQLQYSQTMPGATNGQSPARMVPGSIDD